MLDRRFRLSDGRVLGYDEHGPADGVPLLYFHGAPSVRVEALVFDLPDLADRLRVRLIVPDRPGLGLSDFQPRRQVGDWPADVVALADDLGLDRFAVLGYSGGGPYALACAAMIPTRVTAVGVVGGTTPHDIPGVADGVNQNSLRFMRLAVKRPWLSRLVSWVMGQVARRQPNRLIASALAALPEPDRRYLGQVGRGQLFARMVAESVRRGGRGAQWDTSLMLLPWGFDPTTIQPRVHLWHGEEDRNAPVAMARYLGGVIPTVEPRIIAGEGHLSVLGNHAEEILSTLIAHHQLAVAMPREP
jgi:pimeloyl-ACP methyl ester carboxylesterase